jgi:hypothetical protein
MKTNRKQTGNKQETTMKYTEYKIVAFYGDSKVVVKTAKVVAVDTAAAINDFSEAYGKPEIHQIGIA